MIIENLKEVGVIKWRIMG